MTKGEEEAERTRRRLEVVAKEKEEGGENTTEVIFSEWTKVEIEKK